MTDKECETWTPEMRAEHAALSLIQFLRGQRHPIHVVCNWLGNSPRVVAEHYLRVTESDFQSALGQKTKFGAAKRMKCPKPIQMRSRPRSHITKKPRYFTGFARISLGFIVQKWTIQDSNITAVSAGKQSDPAIGGTESGTLSGELLISDARLVKLIEVWPALADDVKGEMLTLAGLRPYDVDDFNDVIPAAHGEGTA